MHLRNPSNDPDHWHDRFRGLFGCLRRLHLMRQWAKMLNDLGGDVTVVHLPEAGLHGNTHFPMSDLNNAEVAELMYDWLKERGLD